MEPVSVPKAVLERHPGPPAEGGGATPGEQGTSIEVARIAAQPWARTLSPDILALNAQVNQALDRLLGAQGVRAAAMPDPANHITRLLEAGFDAARELVARPHASLRRRDSVVLHTPPIPVRDLQMIRTLSIDLDRLRERIQAGWERLDHEELAAAAHGGAAPEASRREALRALAREADEIESALATQQSAGATAAPRVSLAETAERLRALKQRPAMQALPRAGIAHRAPLGRDEIPSAVQDTLQEFVRHACGLAGRRSESKAHALIQPTEQTLAESAAFTQKFSHYHAALLDLVPPGVRAREAFSDDLQRHTLNALMKARGGKISLSELEALMQGRASTATQALARTYRALMLGALTEGIVAAARQHHTVIDLPAFQADILRRTRQLDANFGAASARARTAPPQAAARAGQALLDPHEQVTKTRQQLEKSGHERGSEALFNLLCRFSEGLLYVESRQAAPAPSLTPPAAPPSA